MTIIQILSGSKNKFALKVLVLAGLLFVSQSIVNPSNAHANPLPEIYSAVSSSLAFQTGFEACGIYCGIAATAATATVNYYGPGVATAVAKTVEPTFINMMTNWASSFFHF